MKYIDKSLVQETFVIELYIVKIKKPIVHTHTIICVLMSTFFDITNITDVIPSVKYL